MMQEWREKTVCPLCSKLLCTGSLLFVLCAVNEAALKALFSVAVETFLGECFQPGNILQWRLCWDNNNKKKVGYFICL